MKRATLTITNVHKNNGEGSVAICVCLSVFHPLLIHVSHFTVIWKSEVARSVHKKLYFLNNLSLYAWGAFPCHNTLYFLKDLRLY